MRRLRLVAAAWLVCGGAAAQVYAAEVAQQVPVKEAVEPIDSPAADAERGNAEARMPSADQPAPASRGEQPPGVEQPPPVEQPAVEP